MAHAFEPSKRALANVKAGNVDKLKEEAVGISRYHVETNATGLIDLSGAQNALVADEIKARMDAFKAKFALEDVSRYGPVAGSEDLLGGVAKIVNKYFKPASPVEARQMIATNGVTSLVNLVTFSLCDPGDGVMILAPTFMMFPHNTTSFSAAQIIPVITPDIPDQYRSDYAQQVVECLEQAYTKAVQSGTRVRMLLLSNPCNPIGRAYSSVTLREFARFCGRHQMHLVSDEIYALSCFEPLEPGLDTFTSVLSIPDDPEHGVYQNNVHTLYGASKDFSCAGLRLGFLVTRSELLLKAVKHISLFSWVTTFSDAFFTHFTSDEKGVDDYFSTYHSRLRQRYADTSQLLHRQGIPFVPANTGYFVTINLEKWLNYFDDSDSRETQEGKLGRYIMKKAGVLLTRNELALSPVLGTFRLVYACVDLQTLELAVIRLSQALKDLEGH